MPITPTPHPSSSNLPSGESQSSTYKWKVLFTVMLGFFMMLLDVTAINVAFPTLRQEFSAHINEAQWVISVYVMSMGISTPLAAFLADRFGSKTVYLSALGLFTVGSLLCGLSSSLYMLVMARILQGIGGGIAVPLGTALLLQAFPVREQGTALGIYGISSLLAPALGPLLGGWLVSLGLWRFIFFINLPIGVLAVLFGIRYLRQGIETRKMTPDIPGMIFSTLGFGAILYAASIAADLSWNSPTTLTWFTVGAVALVAFILVELFISKSPLLDLHLFGNRIFLNASMLGFVATWALYGAEFLMPTYLQLLRGKNALETGVILLSMAITSGILVMLSGRIYDRIGPRMLVVTGFSLLVINTWQLSQLQADTSIQWIIFLLAMRGIALGLTAQTTMATALSVVPKPRLPFGSSLIGSTRQVVQAIGIAVLATIFASTQSADVKALQNQSSYSSTGEAHPLALCSPTMAEIVSSPSPTSSDPNTSNQTDPALLQRACKENIQGFENAYRLTFYAAILAWLLSLFLPGWPFKWSGR